MAKQNKISDRRRPETPGRSNRPTAFSYYANRSSRETNTGREREQVAEQRQKEANRRPKLHLRWQLVLVGLVLLSLIAVVSLFQNPDPKVIVSGSKLSRNSLQASAIYQEAAKTALRDDFFSWFKPSVDSSAVDSKLRSQFPELAVASLQVPLLGFQPKLVIEAYEPSMVVIGNGGSFALDETGTALFASSQLPADVRDKLPLITDNSGLKISAGTDVLPQSDMLFIRQILAYLKAADVKWQDLTLPAAAYEFDVRVSDGYYVKFAMEGGADARQQVGSFLAVRQKLSGDKPKEYIDVRVSERAYYK